MLIYEEEKNGTFTQHLLALCQGIIFSWLQSFLLMKELFNRMMFYRVLHFGTEVLKTWFCSAGKIFCIDLYIVDSLSRNSKYRYNL